MQLVDEMLVARRRQDRDAATQLAADAFCEELAATQLAFDRAVSVATRLTLLRSLANLAREARQWEPGLDLAVRALATDDLRDHRAELFQIVDTLRTYEHLQLAGVELDDRDVQLSVAGPEAAPGFARADEVSRRVEYIRTFMVRNTMRRQGIPFDAGPSRKTKFRETLTPYLSVGRAASYAVTVRFGVHEQTELELKDAPNTPSISVKDAIDDLMLAAKAYSEGGLPEVEQVIPDKQYARNAASLLRQLSPDEERIATVGLTVYRGGGADAVALPYRRALPPVPTWMPASLRHQALPPSMFTVVGRLLEGGAKTPERAWATIVTDEDEPLRIRYDETTHGDIIGEYWKRRVRAQLRREGAKHVMLQDIDDE